MHSVAPQSQNADSGPVIQANAVAPAAPSSAQWHVIGIKAGHRKTMKALAGLQVAIGLACIILHIVLLAINRGYEYVDFVGAGIWCGIIFVIAGILGLCAVRSNTAGLIVSTLVMSIISSLLVWVIIGFSSAGLSTSDRKSVCNVFYSYYYATSCSSTSYTGYKTGDTLLLLLSITELVVAIWCAAVCGKSLCKNGCCCCNDSNYGYQTQGAYYVQSPASGPNIIIMPQSSMVGGSSLGLMVTPGYPLGQQVILTHPMAAYGQQAYIQSMAGALSPPMYAASQAAGSAGQAGAASPTSGADESAQVQKQALQD